MIVYIRKNRKDKWISTAWVCSACGLFKNINSVTEYFIQKGRAFNSCSIELNLLPVSIQKNSLSQNVVQAFVQTKWKDFKKPD